MNQFINDNPYITAFIILMMFYTIFLIINRCLRSYNIKNKGWPPEHLDADGDYIDKNKNNEDDEECE